MSMSNREIPVDAALQGKLWPGVCPCSWSSRCQMQIKDYLVHESIDEACQAMVCFLQKAGLELSKFFGTVGTNASMQALIRNSGFCWDWNTLVNERPTRAHGVAFLELAETLSPVLKKTHFPERGTFAAVPRHWSTNHETRGDLHVQYLYLTARVRAAALGANGKLNAMRLQLLPRDALEHAKG